jgi:hypothetical protein
VVVDLHLEAINLFSGRLWIAFEPDRRATHLAAIKSGVPNPSTKRLVMPESTPNTQSKITGVCVHKTRADSSIATVAMD